MRNRLAQGVGSVVATGASLRADITVVEHDVDKRHRIVTGIAGLCRGNVGSRFAARDLIIMTGLASAVDLAMIHRHYRAPGTAGAMTEFAAIAAIDMASPLAGRVNAIVAIDTRLTADIAVIKHHLPRRGFMTDVAFTAGIEMVRSLADRDTAIMTTGANANHLGVIHSVKRQPGSDVMAGLTLAG